MCNCIETINKDLKENHPEWNTQIMRPFIGPNVAFVEATKLDEKKRVKPKTIFATHCPFCGEKYPEKETQ